MFCARAWQARCTRDAASSGLQAGAQALLLGDIDDIFVDVEGRLRQPVDVGILGQDQRPFEFQHQPAGRRERDDVVALVDQLQQRLRRPCAPLAATPSRSACSSNGMPQHADRRPRFRRRCGQHGARGHAGAGVVVVDEAGGIEHGLALAEGGRRLVDRRRPRARRGSRRSRRHISAGARRDGCRPIFPSAGRVSLLCSSLAQLARRRGEGAEPARCDRSRRAALSTKSMPLLARLHGAMAQHQMREVQRPVMRRHVGALGHEAHVAERAGFHDLGVNLPSSRRRHRRSGCCRSGRTGAGRNRRD